MTVLVMVVLLGLTTLVLVVLVTKVFPGLSLVIRSATLFSRLSLDNNLFTVFEGDSPNSTFLLLAGLLFALTGLSSCLFLCLRGLLSLSLGRGLLSVLNSFSSPLLALVLSINLAMPGSMLSKALNCSNSKKDHIH